MSWDQFLAEVGMQSGGAVRISPGLATTFADVYRCLQFAETFVDTFPWNTGCPRDWVVEEVLYSDQKDFI